MGNRTNYGTGRMTVDNRQKNERSRSGNPYSSHVKAGKHAGTVYNFKRKSRIRKSLTRLPILLEFIHKYIFLNFVSFYNGLNSNPKTACFLWEKFQNCLYIVAVSFILICMSENCMLCAYKRTQEGNVLGPALCACSTMAAHDLRGNDYGKLF